MNGPAIRPLLVAAAIVMCVASAGETLGSDAGFFGLPTSLPLGHAALGRATSPRYGRAFTAFDFGTIFLGSPKVPKHTMLSPPERRLEEGFYYRHDVPSFQSNRNGNVLCAVCGEVSGATDLDKTMSYGYVFNIGLLLGIYMSAILTRMVQDVAQEGLNNFIYEGRPLTGITLQAFRCLKHKKSLNTGNSFVKKVVGCKGVTRVGHTLELPVGSPGEELETIHKAYIRDLVQAFQEFMDDSRKNLRIAGLNPPDSEDQLEPNSLFERVRGRFESRYEGGVKVGVDNKDLRESWNKEDAGNSEVTALLQSEGNAKKLSDSAFGKSMAAYIARKYYKMMNWSRSQGSLKKSKNKKLLSPEDVAKGLSLMLTNRKYKQSFLVYFKVSLQYGSGPDLSFVVHSQLDTVSATGGLDKVVFNKNGLLFVQNPRIEDSNLVGIMDLPVASYHQASRKFRDGFQKRPYVAMEINHKFHSSYPGLKENVEACKWALVALKNAMYAMGEIFGRDFWYDGKRRDNPKPWSSGSKECKPPVKVPKEITKERPPGTGFPPRDPEPEDVPDQTGPNPNDPNPQNPEPEDPNGDPNDGDESGGENKKTFQIIRLPPSSDDPTLKRRRGSGKKVKPTCVLIFTLLESIQTKIKREDAESEDEDEEDELDGEIEEHLGTLVDQYNVLREKFGVKVRRVEDSKWDCGQKRNEQSQSWKSYDPRDIDGLDYRQDLLQRREERLVLLIEEQVIAELVLNCGQQYYATVEQLQAHRGKELVGKVAVPSSHIRLCFSLTTRMGETSSGYHKCFTNEIGGNADRNDDYWMHQPKAFGFLEHHLSNAVRDLLVAQSLKVDARSFKYLFAVNFQDILSLDESFIPTVDDFPLTSDDGILKQLERLTKGRWTEKGQRHDQIGYIVDRNLHRRRSRASVDGKELPTEDLRNTKEFFRLVITKFNAYFKSLQTTSNYMMDVSVIELAQDNLQVTFKMGSNVLQLVVGQYWDLSSLFGHDVQSRRRAGGAGGRRNSGPIAEKLFDLVDNMSEFNYHDLDPVFLGLTLRHLAECYGKTIFGWIYDNLQSAEMLPDDKAPITDYYGGGKEFLTEFDQKDDLREILGRPSLTVAGTVSLVLYAFGFENMVDCGLLSLLDKIQKAKSQSEAKQMQPEHAVSVAKKLASLGWDDTSKTPPELDINHWVLNSKNCDVDAFFEAASEADFGSPADVPESWGEEYNLLADMGYIKQFHFLLTLLTRHLTLRTFRFGLRPLPEAKWYPGTKESMKKVTDPNNPVTDPAQNHGHFAKTFIAMELFHYPMLYWDVVHLKLECLYFDAEYLLFASDPLTFYTEVARLVREFTGRAAKRQVLQETLEDYRVSNNKVRDFVEGRLKKDPRVGAWGVCWEEGAKPAADSKESKEPYLIKKWYFYPKGKGGKDWEKCPEDRKAWATYSYLRLVMSPGDKYKKAPEDKDRWTLQFWGHTKATSRHAQVVFIEHTINKRYSFNYDSALEDELNKMLSRLGKDAEGVEEADENPKSFKRQKAQDFEQENGDKVDDEKPVETTTQKPLEKVEEGEDLLEQDITVGGTKGSDKKHNDLGMNEAHSTGHEKLETTNDKMQGTKATEKNPTGDRVSRALRVKVNSLLSRRVDEDENLVQELEEARAAGVTREDVLRQLRRRGVGFVAKFRDRS